MAIATKNRRKLTIGEQVFVWYICDDYDSADMVLHVVSQDKKFIVNYHLGQPSDTRHLIVLGKEFRGLSKVGAGWIRVLCPEWEKDSIVTPAGVRGLIQWCLTEKNNLMRIDWTGRIFPA
jgi:hypothetical protein